MLRKQIDDAVRCELGSLASSTAYRSYSGACCQRLATELQVLVGVTEVLLASSGTAALEIVLRAAGIVAGDRVLISAYDYPGNFWAIERLGARPVLLDVEPASWNVSASQLEEALRVASPHRPKALIASHLHGQMQAAPQLRQLCDDHGLLFVEDACQAIGAVIDGLPAGSFGHASIFSFGGGKVLSAGRGGAILSKNRALGQKIRLAAGAGSGPYAMSELQAAVVAAQLPWLSHINQQCRQYFGEMYRQIRHAWESSRLVGEPHGAFPWVANVADSAFYQAGFLVDRPGSGPAESTRPPSESLQSQVIERLICHGVPAGTGFPGFFRRSARRCDRVGELSNAQRAAATTCVVHHRIALDEQITAGELASRIMQALQA